MFLRNKYILTLHTVLCNAFGRPCSLMRRFELAPRLGRGVLEEMQHVLRAVVGIIVGVCWDLEFRGRQYSLGLEWKVFVQLLYRVCGMRIRRTVLLSSVR